ncbi:uncharacterized protein H6S33_009300 [Morchella sextelata]|uniref:uncharacterized protein n=1 Tax=Morchella sextelata TaxID=1174677 RepID=UPI001D03949D|nr:uncharacterized protein H6S33_009300 [Morchella sextelata]KAH0612920.1 hypothetical protein H6S33_009300 [Morchella sextelata]
MDSEDGQQFIKHLAHFVRTHEKALANALQLQRRNPRRRDSAPAITGTGSHPSSPLNSTSSSSGSALAAAFSLPSLSFSSQYIKPQKLSLTPHHLYYLLTRFEELNIPVGSMGVRLENIHAESSPANYVSFLRDSSAQSKRRNRSSDSLSIHSVSSVKSVMTGMTSLWSSFGLGTSAELKSARAKAALDADLKYLYSAFTKIPCLRLAPDRKSRLIDGFEEFPFDTAVPLLAFKNVSALEICDIDIRQFFGWDQLAERVRSLTVKRGGIEDPAELIIAIVLDDMDKRRSRSAKSQSSPIMSYPVSVVPAEVQSSSAPPSPTSRPVQIGGSAPTGHYHAMSRDPSNTSRDSSKTRPRSSSPSRPTSSRNSSAAGTHHRSHRMRRSESGSSHSSSTSTVLPGSPRGTSPPTKWRFLRHLSLADNSLTSISSFALIPLANSLSSLDLSSNLFTSIPETLSTLSNLRALNLSNNMIDSLHSLTRNPLPAITALNLRGNRLASIAGIERLLSLERLDLRENKLADPTELARLTGVPNMAEIWVAANPFTKTHPSYRLMIFNLFRSTPGYTDDITLDSQGPGMVEKRSLVERAAELPSVPVVRMPQPQSVVVNTVAAIDPKKEKQESEKSIKMVTSTSDVARAKKKPGRRRVVELGREDSSLSIGEHRLTKSPQPPPVHSSISSNVSTAPKDIPHHPDESSSGAESSPQQHASSSPRENIDWEMRGDEYRRKVEALKMDVGSGWLSVLSEEGMSLAASRKSTPGATNTSPAAQWKRPG